MKSKWILGLLTVALVLALAPSGFAQANITSIQLSLLNAASAAEIAGNRNAQVSDPASIGAGVQLSATVFATSTQVTTVSIILTFPNSITSSMQGANGNFPNLNDSIRISGQTGIFANITSITTINYLAGTITLTLPGGNVNGGQTIGQTGFLVIQGVRIDLGGAVTGTSRALLSAVLAAPTGSTLANGNGYVAPASMPSLINTIQPGAATAAINSTGTSQGLTTIFTTQTAGLFADAVASVLFTEPFASAWRTSTQASTGGPITGNNGTQLTISLAGLPAGLSASFVQQTGTQATVTPATFSLSSATTSQVVSFNGTDMASLDKLGFDVTISGTPTGGSFPAGTTNLVVTAALSPIVSGTSVLGGLTTTNLPNATGGYPRYDATGNTVSVTIGSIIPLQTTLLVPYAIRQAPYESAIAIANTSLDPFPTGSATQTAGTVQFWLFPNSATGIGTMVTVTTNATNATTAGMFQSRGLNASGQVPAGGTFTFTMSMLMSAAGMSGDFVGYIFAQAGFPNAHGIGYVFTNGNLSSATDIEVVPTPSVTSRVNTTGAAESLNF